ncbi:MAG: hypothetical protein ACR2QK_24225 [Acidimicrobiales bacterium]
MSNSVMGLELRRPANDSTGQLFETDELMEFLRDPIAYGQFDWSDPITLDEFATPRVFRGLFVAPLAF